MNVAAIWIIIKKSLWSTQSRFEIKSYGVFTEIGLWVIILYSNINFKFGFDMNCNQIKERLQNRSYRQQIQNQFGQSLESKVMDILSKSYILASSF